MERAVPMMGLLSLHIYTTKNEQNKKLLVANEADIYFAASKPLNIKSYE